MTDARLDPFRTFNFRLEIDDTEVAAFSDVSGLTSTGEAVPTTAPAWTSR